MNDPVTAADGRSPGGTADGRLPVIAAYGRSPFTFARKGALVKLRPDDLAAQVVRGVVELAGSTPTTSRTSSSAARFPRASRGSTSRASSEC